MKRLLILSFLGLFLNISFAQKLIFPSDDYKIFTVDIDSRTWTHNLADGILTIAPKSSKYSSDFLAMMWASQDPESASQATKLTEEAQYVVTTLLTDVNFNEKVSEFENNAIAYYGIDGTGYLKNDDGTKTEMFVTILLLLPQKYDDMVALTFFATPEAYDIYSEDFIDLVLKIK
ncbi:MAG: hypothetical protein GX879_08435 [Bacteroidales bacterium]|nr:hypothetical protein [Bacteroidales bacterium]